MYVTTHSAHLVTQNTAQNECALYSVLVEDLNKGGAEVEVLNKPKQQKLRLGLLNMLKKC